MKAAATDYEKLYKLQEFFETSKWRQKSGVVGNSFRAAKVLLNVVGDLYYGWAGPAPEDIVDLGELDQLVDMIENELPPDSNVQLQLEWKTFSGKYKHIVGVKVVPAQQNEIPNLSPESTQFVKSKRQTLHQRINPPESKMLELMRACLRDVCDCATQKDAQIAEVIKKGNKLAETFTGDHTAPGIGGENRNIILDPANTSVQVSKGMASVAVEEKFNTQGLNFWDWDTWFGGNDDAAAANTSEFMPENLAIYPTYDPLDTEVSDVAFAADAPAGHAEYHSLRNEITSMRRISLNLINHRFANGYSIVANYRPGKANKYTMASSALLALAENPPNLSALDALQMAFYASMEASPEAKQYYSRTFASGFRKVNPMLLSSMFGYAESETGAYYPGEIVRFSHPMSPGGLETAVVVEAEGIVIKTVLVCPNYGAPRLQTSDFGQVVWRWMPAPMTTIAPDSKMGAFWGPNLQVYRQLMDGRYANYFWKQVFQNTSVSPDTIGDFMAVYRRQVLPITKRSPIVPGALLFNDQPEDYAVAANPYSFYCMSKARDKYKMLTLTADQFKPTRIWYPHLQRS
ncbi:hypothetical protein AN189_17760 [Loktanella sp. 3ANDIMAR09]|nr:hypothetical protein AN189_17760 [Loktanella sp. 3ANDIMAR09]